MPFKTAPLKVKITKADGTSELRRLGFIFDSSQLENSGLSQTAQQEQMKVEGYHLSLCKFLLRSLRDLYPDLPVGEFSELAIFSAKDEDGDMVRYDSEEEFVAAMTYNSWESCLRVEVTVLKPAPPTVAAKAEPAAQAEPADQEPSASGNSVYGDADARRSETGSVLSFETDASASWAASSSAASTTSSSPSTPAVSEARSLAPSAHAPAPFREEAEVETGTGGAMTADEGSVSGAADVPASSTPTENDNDNNNDVGLAAVSSPAGPSSSSAAPAGFGDAATPAKAFLTQVLPGLADVLARSMYAAQWVPNGVPDTVAAASSAARDGENPLAPAAEGIATAAASAAASTAARVTATAHSVANTVQARAESAAAAAGAAPAPVPDVPRSVQPPTAAAAAAAAAAGAGAGGAATPPAAAPAAAATAGTPETSPAVHKDVQCDFCDVCPIVGTRYKCAVRSDFDLCEACERSAAGRSPFPFLKIRTPSQAPAAIVCLLKPDQPGSAQEAAAANCNGSGDTNNNNNNNNNTNARAYGPGQAWRTARSYPQQGGWGEGRRNGHRWMRDLARRQQQQQLDSAASGVGIFPPGVEFVRASGNDHGNSGGLGSRPPWCGPRMQRRREEPVPTPAAAAAPAKDAVQHKEAEETAAAIAAVAAAQEAATPPVSVASSEAGEPLADDKTEVEKPAVTSDEPAVSSVEQPSPSAEYHDLLAASMRSLASSMTASFPGPQDGGAGKPRGSSSSSSSNGGGGGGGGGKPMARFVTDVSVSDGSPLPPNTRFVKTWCLRNDGPVTFPPGCKMMPVGGDLMAGPEEGVAVEQRAPGEEFHVSVNLTTPPLSGRYIGYWRLQTVEGQKFGHRVWADVLVTGGTADLVTEGTMDGDWDLVNMQRLSKAVEDTGSAVVEPSVPENIPTSVETPTTASAAAGAAAVARSSPPTKTDGTPMETGTSSAPDTDGGFEESKSSDEAGLGEGAAAAAINQQQASVQTPAAQAASPSSVPQDMATKWHRELCSLAEMGFENGARNVQLLEKHVVESGKPGMERVLHDLLSWREVSIQ